MKLRILALLAVLSGVPLLGVPPVVTLSFANGSQTSTQTIAYNGSTTVYWTSPVWCGQTTSTTSVTIGTGTQTFTTAASLGATIGAVITIADTANVNNYMMGTVTSDVTTALVVNVTTVAGSGTIATWTIGARCQIRDNVGDAGATITGVSGNQTFSSLTQPRYYFPLIQDATGETGYCSTGYQDCWIALFMGSGSLTNSTTVIYGSASLTQDQHWEMCVTLSGAGTGSFSQSSAPTGLGTRHVPDYAIGRAVLTGPTKVLYADMVFVGTPHCPGSGDFGIASPAIPNDPGTWNWTVTFSIPLSGNADYATVTGSFTAVARPANSTWTEPISKSGSARIWTGASTGRNIQLRGIQQGNGGINGAGNGAHIANDTEKLRYLEDVSGGSGTHDVMLAGSYGLNLIGDSFFNAYKNTFMGANGSSIYSFTVPSPGSTSTGEVYLAPHATQLGSTFIGLDVASMQHRDQASQGIYSVGSITGKCDTANAWFSGAGCPLNTASQDQVFTFLSVRRIWFNADPWLTFDAIADSDSLNITTLVPYITSSFFYDRMWGKLIEFGQNFVSGEETYVDMVGGPEYYTEKPTGPALTMPGFSDFAGVLGSSAPSNTTEAGAQFASGGTACSTGSGDSDHPYYEQDPITSWVLMFKSVGYVSTQAGGGNGWCPTSAQGSPTIANRYTGTPELYQTGYFQDFWYGLEAALYNNSITVTPDTCTGTNFSYGMSSSDRVYGWFSDGAGRVTCNAGMTLTFPTGTWAGMYFDPLTGQAMSGVISSVSSGSQHLTQAGSKFPSLANTTNCASPAASTQSSPCQPHTVFRFASVTSTPAILTAMLPAIPVNSAMSTQTLQAVGGTGPYTWVITKGCSIPGITFSASAGTFTGTPTVVGNWLCYVEAKDSLGVLSPEQQYHLFVVPPPSFAFSFNNIWGKTSALIPNSGGNHITIIGGLPPVTCAFSAHFANSIPGGDGMATRNLCAWNSTTSSSAAQDNVIFTITDAAGSVASASIVYTVGSSVPFVNTFVVPFNFALTQNRPFVICPGGANANTETITTVSGAIPTGLAWHAGSSSAFDTNCNSTPNLRPSLSGVPTVVQPSGGHASTWGDTVNNFSWSGVFTVNNPISIVTSVLPAAVVGVPYCAQILTSGGTASRDTYLDFDSVLPSWAVLEPISGYLCGIPSSAGSGSFKVSVTDANASTAIGSVSWSAFSAQIIPAVASGTSVY